MSEITIAARAPFTRSLHLRLARGSCLYAALYPARGAQMLAWSSAELTACRLTHNETGWTLWLAGTAFDVSAAEAERIQVAFPKLRVEIVPPEPLPYLALPVAEWAT